AGQTLGLDSVRMCVSAGEALPGKVFEDWMRETGISILDGIGSTRKLHIFFSNHPHKPKPEFTRQLIEGDQTKTLDARRHEVDSDKPGNLWVRGPSATTGYWNMPELTADVIRQGWIRTGDLYRRDADG